MKNSESISRSSRPYQIWSSLKTRIYGGPSAPGWMDLGGAGVTMCKAWTEDFHSFMQDVGTWPGKGHSLERIDPNLGFQPGNCQWIPIAPRCSPFVQMQFKVSAETSQWIMDQGGSPFVRWVMETLQSLPRSPGEILMDRDVDKVCQRLRDLQT